MDGASLNPPLRASDRVVVLGSVPPEWMPWAGAAELVAHDPAAAGQRVEVDALVERARHDRPANGRLVVVTDGDLFIPECDSLIGFAHARAKVAIVSTARLATSDVAQTRRRLANAITHELGHLDGLRHCARACVMRPVADASELDDRPGAPCGHCPRRRSRLLAIVASLAVVLAVIGVGGRLLDRRRPPPRAPAVPPAIAALLDELPADTGHVASRPVDVVVQRFGTGTFDAPLTVPASTLPAGIRAAALSRTAASMASARYRTPEPEPIVHVHVFEARGDLSGLLDTLRIAGSDAIVRPRPPHHAVLVFAPALNAREMAARLAASVDVGGGLRQDADMSLMFGALPARLPDGLALDSASATNVHRVPEAIDETTRRFFRDGAAAADELRRVMPLALITADYRGDAGAHAGVVIGYYGLTPSAWMSRFTLGWILKPWDAGTIKLASGQAWRLAAGPRQYAVWRQGRFVAAVYAEGPRPPDLLLRALADALQL